MWDDVAAVAADNHCGQAVGYDLLLLLLWECSCCIVGKIALLVGDIVGLDEIVGSGVAVAEIVGDMGIDRCRDVFGVGRQRV